MYLIWTKDSIDHKHCVLLAKTLEDVKIKLDEFKNTNGIDLNDSEYDLIADTKSDFPISFSRIHPSQNFYYTKLDDLTNKKYVYILEYIESGEGQSYHEWVYISYSYNLNDILNTAQGYFESESEQVDDKSIKKLMNDLKKKGCHNIEEPIQYACGFELYKLNLQ